MKESKDWRVRIYYHPSYPRHDFVVERVVWIENGGAPEQAAAMAQQHNVCLDQIRRVEVEEVPRD
jgi:hypothetical protein